MLYEELTINTHLARASGAKNISKFQLAANSTVSNIICLCLLTGVDVFHFSHAKYRKLLRFCKHTARHGESLRCSKSNESCITIVGYYPDSSLFTVTFSILILSYYCHTYS